jgi:hypothetical protein
MSEIFQWKKLGKVFDPTQGDYGRWMAEFAQGPATLIHEDFVRVYFSTRPLADVKGQYVSYSGFVDLDRNDLFNMLRVSERPILTLGGLGAFDEFGTYPVSVIKHGSKLTAYYGGWTRCESVPFNVAIGAAESSDNGTTFQRLGPGPVIPYTPDEPFIMSGPKIRRFDDDFVLFYIAGRKWIVDGNRPEPVYKIRMARSRDGYNWTKTGRDLIVDTIGENEAQASPDVIFLDGTFHMFFCYRHGTGYRGRDRGYRIGYASSPDLDNWTRRDEFAGLDISETGWDSEMVSYPHVFELDGKVYMLYLGNSVGRQGFGLAVLEGS